MASMNLTSPAFEDGDRIPERYGYTADNVNPPLEIVDVPEVAASLAIVMDDPDAVKPAGKVWDHWVVWNVDPEVTSIPEAWDATGAVEGRNDFGESGYGGPNPPDREHTYRFIVYALDVALDLEPEATKADLEAAIEGHVIERSTLKGTFEP